MTSQLDSINLLLTFTQNPPLFVNFDTWYPSSFSLSPSSFSLPSFLLPSPSPFRLSPFHSPFPLSLPTMQLNAIACLISFQGVRSQHPVHCQDQVEKHLSLARVRISVLEITNANWETRFAIANAGFSSAIADISRAIADLEARSCNGESLWHINNYSKHLAAACLGSPYCVDSQPFYTSFNGYKFHLRYSSVWM